MHIFSFNKCMSTQIPIKIQNITITTKAPSCPFLWKLSVVRLMVNMGNDNPRKCMISKHGKKVVLTWQGPRKGHTSTIFRFRHFPSVCLPIKLKLICTLVQKPTGSFKKEFL